MREKMACRCADAYEQFMTTAVRPVLEPKIGEDILNQNHLRSHTLVPAILLHDSINEAKTRVNVKKKGAKTPVDATEHTIDDLLQFVSCCEGRL